MLWTLYIISSVYRSPLLNGWSAALCLYSNRWRFTYSREREREREELGKNLWMNSKVYGPMRYSSTGPSFSQNNGLEGEVMRTRPDGELFLVMILNWNYFFFVRRHIILFFSPVERQMRCIKLHLTWYLWDYWKKILLGHHLLNRKTERNRSLGLNSQT